MSIIEEIILLAQFKNSLNKMIMSNKIIPSLWFDNQAKEAFDFYTDVYSNSSIIKDSPIVVEANIMGFDFIGINGGPMFKPNPSISYMAVFESKKEVDTVWEKLLIGGQILMPLDQYPFSEYYGWVQDKYGFNWQLYYGKLENVNHQAIVPTLMFGGSQQGKCKEALKFYQELFPDFVSQGILEYPDGATKGQVMHTQFTVNGVTLAAMDSGVPQEFSFNEANSLTITCNDQNEIDYFWNKIVKDGKESMCGWCKDQFGMSWQIVPKDISKMLKNPDSSAALMKMKKIEIAKLLNPQK